MCVVLIRSRMFRKPGKWTRKNYCLCILLSIVFIIMYCTYGVFFLVPDSKTYSPEDISYVLNPCNYCSSGKGPEIVIMVISKPGNFQVRKAIRSTWGNVNKTNVSVLFLVGKDSNKDDMLAIAEEFRNHGDIIQANFQDSYRNLTLKSLVMLHWMQNYCPTAEFLLKSDDDVYVNVRCLLCLARKVRDSVLHNVMLGRYIVNREVVRNPFDKWFVSSVVYRGKLWPIYLRGPSYFLDRIAFERMAIACFKHSIVPMEDVVLTGLCAEALNIVRRDVKSFHVFQADMNSPCNSDAITVTEVMVNDMYRLNDIERNCTQYRTNSDLDNLCKNSVVLPL